MGDRLRSITDEAVAKERPRLLSEGEEYEAFVAAARVKLEEAARTRLCSVPVLKISAGQGRLIDLSFDEPLSPTPWLEAPGLVESEEYKAFLHSVPLDRLRGAAARLRRFLEDEGLRCDLAHRIEGMDATGVGTSMTWLRIGRFSRGWHSTFLFTFLAGGARCGSS